MIELAAVKRLSDAQAEHAREALTKPGDRDAFAYGHAQGFYAGLEYAKSVLQNLIDDRDRRENDL